MNHSVIILAQGGLGIGDASHYDPNRSSISDAVMVTGSTFRSDRQKRYKDLTLFTNKK